jgi:hypothetical protein
LIHKGGICIEPMPCLQRPMAQTQLKATVDASRFVPARDLVSMPTSLTEP